MDTLLAAGDHAVDGRGLPVAVGGARELVQRAMIRLCVPKGSFARDPALGSSFARLAALSGQARDRAALSFAQEALAPLRQVRVEGAACALDEPDRLLVRVSLAIADRHYTLEVRPDDL